MIFAGYVEQPENSNLHNSLVEQALALAGRFKVEAEETRELHITTEVEVTHQHEGSEPPHYHRS